MKNVTILSIASALLLSYTPITQASNIAEQLCQYVNQDDKNRVRKLLRSSNLRLRAVYDDVQCNGQNLLDFAVSSNANETGKLIISKLPKSDVKDSLSKIQASGNAELFSAAQERVGG